MTTSASDRPFCAPSLRPLPCTYPRHPPFSLPIGSFFLLLCCSCGQYKCLFEELTLLIVTFYEMLLHVFLAAGGVRAVRTRELARAGYRLSKAHFKVRLSAERREKTTRKQLPCQEERKRTAPPSLSLWHAAWQNPLFPSQGAPS